MYHKDCLCVSFHPPEAVIFPTTKLNSKTNLFFFFLFDD